jgi:hypothetical protein
MLKCKLEILMKYFLVYLLVYAIPMSARPMGLCQSMDKSNSNYDEPESPGLAGLTKDESAWIRSAECLALSAPSRDNPRWEIARDSFERKREVFITSILTHAPENKLDSLFNTLLDSFKEAQAEAGMPQLLTSL